MADFHSPPFMPLYCGDYLRDTQRLSTIEHGAYFLLIMEYWVTGGPLPDDEIALSRICRASLKRFRGIRSGIEIFFVVGAGLWRHKRIDRELEKAGKLTEFRHMRAKSGAAARWMANATSNALSMPEASFKQCPSSSQPHIDNPDRPNNGAGRASAVTGSAPSTNGHGGDPMVEKYRPITAPERELRRALFGSECAQVCDREVAWWLSLKTRRDAGEKIRCRLLPPKDWHPQPLDPPPPQA